MKPVLFIDFDGTLCFDRFWKSLDAKTAARIDSYIFGNRDLVNDWMRSKCASEDVNKILAKELHIDYDYLWKLFVRDCETMAVDADVLKKIGSLRTSYVTVLMTDNMDCFDRFTVPALGLTSYFDEIASSFSRGTLKRDNGGAAYSLVMNSHRAPVKASILIDDSRDTCDIFESLGGKACLIDSRHSLRDWLENVS